MAVPAVFYGILLAAAAFIYSFHYLHSNPKKRLRGAASDTPSIRTTVEGFGAVVYRIPRVGEHGLLSCYMGRHYLVILRQNDTGKPLGLMCGACKKILGPIHDITEEVAL